MPSESHINVSKDDLSKIDLGALVSKEVLFNDPISGTRVWEYEFERGTVRKTEWYGEGAFLAATSEELKATDGQRFGDARKVASVPMHVWAREIAPRQRDGNDASIKRWLNGDAGKAFRTFKGKV